MTFGGVSRPSERADILAYLNSLSDSPAPLPKAELAPATRLAAQ
jgi:cytochrome c